MASLTARFSADFSSFESAVRKAEVNLRSFETGSNKVESALSRLTNSFSGQKLISDATLMTEAVNRIGGMSRLTATELAALGTKANEAADKMRRMGLDVPPGLQKIADATKANTSLFGSWGGEVAKVAAGFLTAQAIIGGVKGVVGGLTGFVVDSVKAANEAEKANVQMTAALRAQGTAIPTVITAYQGYAAALERTTVFQDDALEGSIALLTQVGNVMPRDMQKALQATTELASGLGIDLQQATMMVALAAEGTTTGLKKLGVETVDVKGKALGFGQVLDSITEKFGGQAAAIAGTYEGRLIQLGNTWNNLEESAGRVITQNATLLEAFNRLNGFIGESTGELTDNATATNLVSEATILGVRSVSAFGTAFDVAQTFGAGFFLTIREGGAALGNLAAATLAAARALYLFKGEKLDKHIADLDAAVAELGKRNEGTTQRSVAMGQALGTLSSVADRLATDLEKTKGKVVALDGATSKGAEAWGRNTVALNANAEAGRKGQQELDKMKDRLKDIESGTPPATFKILAFSQALESIGKVQPIGAPVIRQLTDGFLQIGKVIPIDRVRTLTDAFATLGVRAVQPLDKLATLAERDAIALKKMSDMFVRLGQASGGTLGKMLSDIGQLTVILDAAYASNEKTGGSLGLANDLFREGATGAERWGSAVETAATVASGAIELYHAKTAASGAASGAKIGTALMPGWGTAIGAAAGAIWGAFGGQRETKKVNDMRDAFLSASGGLHAMNVKAKEAGLTLDRLLNTDNVKAYTAETERLQRAFDFQNTALDALADAEEKYHLSLDTTSADLFSSYKLLTAGGRDANAVVFAMKDDWQALATEARRFGIALPESLRPILQRMVDLGELVDENGEKLTDLSAISFSETGDSGVIAFERMREGADKFAAAIKLLVGAELTALERQLLAIDTQLRGIDHIFRNLPNRPVVDAPVLSGLSAHQAGALNSSSRGGDGGEIVINITTTLDGDVIEKNTTRRQSNNYHKTHRSRAA